MWSNNDPSFNKFNECLLKTTPSVWYKEMQCALPKVLEVTNIQLPSDYSKPEPVNFKSIVDLYRIKADKFDTLDTGNKLSFLYYGFRICDCLITFYEISSDSPSPLKEMVIFTCLAELNGLSNSLSNGLSNVMKTI